MKPGAAIQLAQRQRNQELLQHVADHQSCSFEELLGMFGGPAADVDASQRFIKRLYYLVDSGRLRSHISTVDGVRHWTLPPVSAEPSIDAHRTRTRDCAPVDAWVGTVAAPRQNSVLAGPLYVPDRDCALRAGALDYKRFASHGVRC